MISLRDTRLPAGKKAVADDLGYDYVDPITALSA